MSATDVQVPPAADLSNCEREAIHIIGAIQSIGFLIALSPDWIVTRVSANAATHLGRPVAALLGAPLHDLIGIEAIHTIRNRLASLRGEDSVERAFGVRLQDDGERFDLGVHMSGQTIIIEAEPSQAPGEHSAGTMVRSMLERMRGQANVLREAARLVQALTGFDRVMIYRFHADGSGEVVAERARFGLEPYLGLHYPASDIPSQARAMLLRNPIRMLTDVEAEPSPLVPQLDVRNQPLDLTMSTLRAHSLMHIEYLRNMGVRATMTISLVRDGVLWGLISCHHMTPRHVGYERRSTAELFAQVLTFLIEKSERDQIAAYEVRTRLLHNELMAAVIDKSSTGENIAALTERMAELMPCDGVAMYVDGNVTLKGITPTLEEFASLQDFLKPNLASQIYATEALGDVHPPARAFIDRAAGLLVIPISRSPCDYIVFFRQEMARAVMWAGNPAKVLEPGPNGLRMTPRRSFEAWREIVRGHSTPWTEAELRTAEALRVTLLEVVLHLIGMTERERQAAAQKQELLIAELNHRVRNILGLIRGLVSQSRTSAIDVDTFATVLGDRVHALARAHDQITAKNWGPGALATLVAAEASAYLGEGAVRIHAGGPSVLLQPEAFSTMALVIHELMTNAAKYGALLGPDGQVMIQWGVDPAGDVILDWTEIGGPPVQPPTRRGFGSTIIERSIPHELGGETTVVFAPTGLRMRLSLPSRYVVVGEDTTIAAATVAITSLPTGVSGAVLLVEDNLVIALNAEDMLLALGATHVTVASSVAEALQLLAGETPSFALLDVNLGRETSWPVAARLRELGVPHVFATGYGDGGGVDYPPEYRQTPSITKPYTSVSIARAVTEAAAQMPNRP